MKNRTALLVVLFLLSGFGNIAFASCPERVKKFYLQYMTNIESRFDSQKDKTLKEIYLTETLVKKSIPDMIERTDIDPIIRAQDMNKTGIETLAVRSLGNDWYMVSYYWKKGDESTLTQIPIKTTGSGDNCKICYITPPWEGLKYGEELALNNKPEGNGLFVNPELPPTFKQGDDSLKNYLRIAADKVVRNYRDSLSNAGIDWPWINTEVCKFRIIVSFFITEEGKIKDAYVVRGCDYPVFDEAAVRIVNEMPDWTPGRFNDKPKRVKYTLPVTFLLNE